MRTAFASLALCCSLTACGSDRASMADTQAETETGEAGSAEGAETQAETNGEESGGPECEAHYGSSTSFSVDLSAWPVDIPEWQVVALSCVTTQAELQGLGMVFAFDCNDSSGGSGAIQVTFAPTSGIEPDLILGAGVTLYLEGGNFGGLQTDGPVPAGFDYPATAISIHDEEGLVAGGVSGISVPASPFFAQFGFEFASPCGEPDMDTDFDGELVVSEPGVDGGASATVGVAEAVELESALGGSYRFELGRLVRYGCCETPWAVDFVAARL